MVKRKAKLARPDIEMAHRLASFFVRDDGVQTVFDSKRHVLRLYCSDSDKAEALNKVIRITHTFSGLFLTVAVYPPNNRRLKKFCDVVDPREQYELMQIAFKGNPLVKKFSECTDELMGATFFFCETAKYICQYQADNLSNPYGFSSALASDVLADLVRCEKILISTWATDS